MKLVIYKIFNWIHSTSYETQAIRQGFATEVKPFGLAALITTADHYLVFGVHEQIAAWVAIYVPPAGIT
jgi:hypothetical protein